MIVIWNKNCNINAVKKKLIYIILVSEGFSGGGGAILPGATLSKEVGK